MLFACGVAAVSSCNSGGIKFMNFNVIGLSDREHIVLNEKKSNGLTYLEISLIADEKMPLSDFRIKFSFPVIDCYSTFSPSMGFQRNLNPNWSKKVTNSHLASWMPLHSILSLKGKNRLCIAVSDVKTPIVISTGVTEETAEFDCNIEFKLSNTEPKSEYTAIIRIDTRDIHFCDSVYGVSKWWEEFYTPAYVPEAAKMPMNSLWYSFHQDLQPESILKQCALSKEIGLDTVIIDDGWQTEDNNRGYAYCGDWQPCDKKIPDIKKLVDDIHKTGMKVMLWFSVPYVGVYSNAYKKFENMLLKTRSPKFFVFDPRYKEVREYLCNIYERAIRDWGFDGLKLDFIDAILSSDKSYEYNENMDYESLEESIDVLMKQVNQRLVKINPETLIEFRQSYIGPAIRSYGNMLRVRDCPNDGIINRIAIADMRLTSGRTPVHSDMIMWNYDDSVESASLQFVDILYGVPQVSMLIDKLSPSHYKMLKFYINFWREHRDILLFGKFSLETPHSLYSQAKSILNEKSVITVYTDKAVTEINDYTVIVNASPFSALFVKGAKGKNCKVLNCMGEVLETSLVVNDIEEISVPLGGMMILE